MENPIKIHDLGVPLFLETPISEFHEDFWNIWSQADNFKVTRKGGPRVVGVVVVVVVVVVVKAFLAISAALYYIISVPKRPMISTNICFRLGRNGVFFLCVLSDKNLDDIVTRKIARMPFGIRYQYMDVTRS